MRTAVKITFDSKGGTVVLPDDLTLEEAIRINEEGQRFDGIDRIDEDGTVHFVDEHMAIVKDMIGYECKSMRLEDTEEQYKELDRKFKAFAAQYK